MAEKLPVRGALGGGGGGGGLGGLGLLGEEEAACGVLLPAESRSKLYERQQKQAIARSKRN